MYSRCRSITWLKIHAVRGFFCLTQMSRKFLRIKEIKPESNFGGAYVEVGVSWRSFIDKQNEGTYSKEDHVWHGRLGHRKELEIRKANHTEIRWCFVLCTLNKYPCFMVKGNDIDLYDISMKTWKRKKNRVNKRKTKIVVGRYYN